jgi:hypothetical protein
MASRVHFRELFSETGPCRFTPTRRIRIRSHQLEPGACFGEGHFFSGLELAAMRNYDLEIQECAGEVLVTAYYPRAALDSPRQLGLEVDEEFAWDF